MASRCFSPPLSRMPLSPTMVSYWRGMRMMASCSCREGERGERAEAKASHDSRKGGARS